MKAVKRLVEVNQLMSISDKEVAFNACLDRIEKLDTEIHQNKEDFDQWRKIALEAEEAAELNLGEMKDEIKRLRELLEQATNEVADVEQYFYTPNAVGSLVYLEPTLDEMIRKVRHNYELEIKALKHEFKAIGEHNEG